MNELHNRTARLFAAAITAPVAGAVVLLIFPTRYFGVPWIGESVLALAMGAIWMLGALLFARKDPVAGPLLFLAGAATVMFLTRGIVHTISPWYGLISFLAACFGGGFVWIILTEKRSRTVAILLPLLTSVCTCAAVLMFAKPGFNVEMLRDDGTTTRVSVARSSLDSTGITYIWEPGAPAERPGIQRVKIEMDPGSGHSQFLIEPIENDVKRGEACRVVRRAVIVSAEDEVANGATPRFMLRLPAGTPNCLKGALWRARPDR